jgi:hypothetical protein
MTKYFDKLQKIKFYILCYPSHGNMKNNVILGHVDFFQNILDMTNNNIFHYLMPKSSKKSFNKHLNTSFNLNILIIL